MPNLMLPSSTALAMLLCLGILQAQLPGQDEANLVFRSVPEARNYCEVNNVDRIALDFEAVVNLWNPAEHLLFVGYDDGAVYIQLEDEVLASGMDLQLGTLVRVQGYFDHIHYFVRGEEVEIIGPGTPQAAERVEMSKLALGQLWSRRVATRGFVKLVIQNEFSTYLHLQDQGTSFSAQISGTVDRQAAEELANASVEVTGTLDYAMDEYSRPIEFYIRSNPEELPLVVRPAIERERPISLEQLLTTKQIPPDGNKSSFKLHGQVSFLCDAYALIEDNITAVKIDGPFLSHEHLRIGDMVDVTGSLSLLGEKREINPTFIARGASARLQPAGTVDAADVDPARLPVGRVLVSGELLKHAVKDRERHLLLKSGQTLFSAKLKLDEIEFDQLQIGDIRRLTITGAIEPAMPNWGEFTINAGAAPQLQVTERWERIGTNRMIGFGLSALVILLLTIAWGAASRIQIARKTQKLQHLTARLNSSQEAVKEGLLIISNQDVVLSSTNRIKEILDFAPKVDQRNALRQISHRMENAKEFLEFCTACFSNSAANHSQEFQLRNGSRFVSVYSAPVRDEGGMITARLWSFDDITDRKELETSLIQSQKMEAVGRLAGGIAHDFNNLLMAISGNLELAKINPEKPVRQVLEAINGAEMATDRAASLVRHLLGFSKQSGLNLQTTNANVSIKNLYELLVRTLEPSVEIRLALASDLWTTDLDEVQFQQVLLNICLNARDALVEGKGWIRISTRNISNAEGEFVEISISDNGIGMSEEVRSKIFEPFFTTKPTGQGTGLGLAMSYGIIKQHHGSIECESTPGFGAAFTILLQRSQTSTPIETYQSHPNTANPMVVASARVLLGEDSELVRESCATMLTTAGFEVRAVSNGAELLNEFRDDSHYHVAIVDLSMPVFSGRETYRQLRALAPKLPIIICSGHHFDVEEFARATGEAPTAFVQKPFRRAELLGILQEILSRPQNQFASSQEITQ